MNDIRAKFEEIWPVPDGIRWESDYMKGNDYYAPDTEHGSSEEHWIKADEWNDRLDTFTRCQETTAIYLSLIEELVQEVESCHADLRSENWYVPRKSELLERAKQKLEQIK